MVPTDTFPEMSHTERELRRMLCVRMSIGGMAYMDDGEAQCNAVQPFIDFMRDTPHEIQQKHFQRMQSEAYKKLLEQPLLKPSYFEIGMGYEHDMPCAIYTNTEHAVLDTSCGVFKPSWRAQKEGWKLVQAKTKFQKWLLRKFFPKNFWE